MYLRLLRAKFDQERLGELKDLYQSQVVPALSSTKGCLFAGLLQSTSNPDECISMTLWENNSDAEHWESSQIYGELVGQTAALFPRTTEITAHLGQPRREPTGTTEAFTLEAGNGGRALDSIAPYLFLRIVSIRVRSGHWDELLQIYNDEVIPTMLATRGCRAAFLLEGLQDPDRGLSISFWDREEDAVRYEISGTFDALTRKLLKTLTATRNWQMALTSEGVAQGTPPTEGYRILVSQKM